MISGVTRGLLVIALIAGLVTGCTAGADDPQPTPSPSLVSTTTSSPSPSPSRTGPLTTGPNVRPGEKPPMFPPQSRHRTEAGALQFAVYYFKVYDWGYATNDTYPVASISLPSCEGCQLYLNGLKALERDHTVLTGGRIRIRSASVFQGTFREHADFAIDVAVDEEPVVIHSLSGDAKTVSRQLASYHSLIYVLWTAHGWRVTEVGSR
jgi:hypothetical protein